MTASLRLNLVSQWSTTCIYCPRPTTILSMITSIPQSEIIMRRRNWIAMTRIIDPWPHCYGLSLSVKSLFDKTAFSCHLLHRYWYWYWFGKIGIVRVCLKCIGSLLFWLVFKKAWVDTFQVQPNDKPYSDTANLSIFAKVTLISCVFWLCCIIWRRARTIPLMLTWQLSDKAFQTKKTLSLPRRSAAKIP